jgi:hypothetical protein
MNQIIENLSPNVGHLKLTRTMLEKHIIDANASVQKLALLLGVDMAKLAAGEKLELVGEYTDGTPCKIRLYRAATRGDKRISISGLKQQAEAGDDIALSYRRTDAGGFVLVVNITAELMDKRTPNQNTIQAKRWGLICGN